MYQIQKPDTGLEGRSFLYFRMDYGATLPQYPVTVRAHGFTSQFVNTDVPNALTYQEAYAAPPQAFGLAATNASGQSRVLLVTSSTVTAAQLNPRNWANACTCVPTLGLPPLVVIHVTFAAMRSFCQTVSPSTSGCSTYQLSATIWKRF